MILQEQSDLGQQFAATNLSKYLQVILNAMHLNVSVISVKPKVYPIISLW